MNKPRHDDPIGGRERIGVGLQLSGFRAVRLGSGARGQPIRGLRGAEQLVAFQGSRFQPSTDMVKF